MNAQVQNVLFLLACLEAHPLQRSNTNRSTLITSQIEIAIGLICTCLPTINEYFQSRKRLEGHLRGPQPSMKFRTRRFLEANRLRRHRLDTPEGGAPMAPQAAPGGILVERDILIAGTYTAETSPRPPSYCLQASTMESSTASFPSPVSGVLRTNTVHQSNAVAPPIPEKSSARLSMHRNSWGPSTSFATYMDAAPQASEKGALMSCRPVFESQYASLPGKDEFLPFFPPPLFSQARDIQPIPEVTTPVSSILSAQHSPGMLRWSPRWAKWPPSPTQGSTPPISPIQDLLESLERPKLCQVGGSERDYRHYSF